MIKVTSRYSDNDMTHILEAKIGTELQRAYDIKNLRVEQIERQLKTVGQIERRQLLVASRRKVRK